MKIEIETKYLKALLVSVPTHEVRYYLCGINFKSKDGRITAVSTDGHRISQWLIANDYKGEDFNFIMSKKAIKAAVASKQDHVVLNTAEQHIELEYGTVAGLIDGKYPDTDRVLNRSTIENKDGGCYINSSYIADAIKIANMLCPKNRDYKLHQVNSSPNTTVLFTFTNVDDFLHGIMPMRGECFDEHQSYTTLEKVLSK